MKRRLAFCSVAVTLVTFFCSLSSAAMLDSSLFTDQYNGDVYPVSGYAETGPWVVAPSSDGNILTYQSDVASGGGFFVQDPWAADAASGWTLEFRLKIGTDAPEGSDGAFAFFMADGSNGLRTFFIGQNSFRTTSLSDTSDNTDGFHTFRVAKAAGTLDFNLWRDGVAVGSVNGWGGSTFGSDDFLFWADGGGAVGGPTVEVDYVRFDITGAYEPVIPEPSSCLSLAIAMGGVILTRRRPQFRMDAK